MLTTAMATVADLYISEARLGKFWQQKGDSKETLVSRHLFNQAVGAALYAPLQNLEIALRNSLCSEFDRRFGNTWLTNLWLVTNDESCRKDRAKIDSVINSLQDAAMRQYLPPPSTLSSNLITELGLGLWVNLMNKRYTHPRKELPYAFWPASYELAFPSAYALHVKQTDLTSRLYTVLELRNAVFHHRIITLGVTLSDGAKHPLEEMARYLQESIELIAPRIAKITRKTETLTGVLQAGPEQYLDVAALVCKNKSRP